MTPTSDPSPGLRPPPFLLPRFTFLSGPSLRDQPLRDDFAMALCTLDSELLPLDFEEPLRMATCALFYGGFSLECDLTRPALRRAQLLPGVADATAEDFMADLRMSLRAVYGPGVLGHLALADYRRDGTDLMHDRTVFRDATQPADVRVFADAFGMNAILVLHIGELRNAVDFGPGRHIWLPRHGLDAMLTDLTREMAL